MKIKKNMNFIYKKNNKIIKREKIVLLKELDFEPAKKFDIEQLDKFYKKFNNYMLTCKLLFTNPSVYSILKFIQLDQTMNRYELAYHEIIWIHEHYNFIEELRLIENDFNDFVSYAYNFGWISKIQFKLVTKIMCEIPNIFHSDIVFSHLYSHNLDNKLPTQNQLDYYFNIIEIIILKMYQSTKNKNKKKYSIDELLLDDKYIRSINNLKNQLKSNLGQANMI